MTSGCRAMRVGVQAQRLDGLVEHDLAAVDGEAARGHQLGDVARGHRAVELAGIAGLADGEEALAGELGRDRLGLLLQLEIARLELGAILLEALEVLGRWRAAPSSAAAGSCAHSRP